MLCSGPDPTLPCQAPTVIPFGVLGLQSSALEHPHLEPQAVSARALVTWNVWEFAPHSRRPTPQLGGSRPDICPGDAFSLLVIILDFSVLCRSPAPEVLGGV